jgi:RNA polymerase sigma factor (sigma-70 family)
LSIIEDRLLLWKLRNGNGDALRRVYEKYKGPMVSVAVGMTGDIQAAEDAMQDAFVSFAEKAAEGAVRSNLKAYLMTSVANSIRHRFRRKSSEDVSLGQMDAPAAGPEVADQVATMEDADRLKVALSRLPDEQREAITLRIHGQLSFEQVAAAQESNANTARTRYRRGIENLRHLMNGDSKNGV